MAHLNERHSGPQVEGLTLAFADRLIAALEAKNLSDPGWVERKAAMQKEQADELLKPASRDCMNNIFAKAVGHLSNIGI